MKMKMKGKKDSRCREMGSLRNQRKNEGIGLGLLWWWEGRWRGVGVKVELGVGRLERACTQSKK